MQDPTVLDKVLGLFNLKRIEEEPISSQQLPSIAPPENADGATTVEIADPAGSQSATHSIYSYNITPVIKTTKEQIENYRKTSKNHEVAKGIDEIVNQAIVNQNDDEDIVELDLQRTKFSDQVKLKIQEEFETILRLYSFNKKADDIFRDWYIDSRVAYHKMFDPNKMELGIQELRRLDPRFLEKVRVVKKGSTPQTSQLVTGIDEFYSYKPENTDARYLQLGYTGSEIRIPVSSLIFVHSNQYDCTKTNIVSYLEEAIRPANSLRLLEDASIIYRLARAPERRVFYVDVSGMPKAKGEQYMQNIMNRFKNKIVYDSASGKLKTKYDTQSILEDYWLPRKEGRATEVSTLPGGQNLGQIDELKYFKKNLYESLRVPFSRFDSDTASTFNISKPSEITRDELRFSRFINRLQRKFGDLLLEPLKTQLILKKVITPMDWEKEKENIRLRFNTDTYYEELKENEIMQSRVDLANSLEPHVNKYISPYEVMRRAWKQTDADQEKQRVEIEQAKKDERFRKDAGF